MQVVDGSGKFERTGFSSHTKAKESVNIAYNYFKANSQKISGTINIKTKDFHLHVIDLQGIGLPDDLTLLAFLSLCSGVMKRSMQEQIVVLGSMSIGGIISKVNELSNTLQVCFDAGAKRLLLPMSSATDIPTVPADLFVKFQTSFYKDPIDAVYKVLSVA